MKNAPLSNFEVFLIETIVYIVLWLWNEYVATILTLSFTAIAFFILAVSLISEAIERSKVPRWYFSYMLISVFTPLLTEKKSQKKIILHVSTLFEKAKNANAACFKAVKFGWGPFGKNGLQNDAGINTFYDGMYAFFWFKGY